MHIQKKIGFLYVLLLTVSFICVPVMAANTIELNSATNEATLASFDKILETEPNNFQAWVNRAGALQDLNRNTEALESYDRALQINPNSTMALNNRGTVLYTLGRYNDAVSSFDQVLKISPNDSQAWTNRGEALFKAGRYDEAIASYDKVDPHSSVYSHAQNNRNLTLTQKSKTPTSIPIQPSQQPTQKASLIYAPFGAIAIMVALMMWRRQR
jgi:tetratricopeptide (TPR) repeat protein